MGTKIPSMLVFSRLTTMSSFFRNKKILLVTLALLGAVSLMAQVRRVGTVNPLSPRQQSSYDVVYDFDMVDEQPKFPGGECGLTNYVNETREYPYHAYQKKIQGRVLCSFIVGVDGRVSNVELVRGACDESLNREAMRVIAEMPRWTPGRVAGQKVPVRVILPIAFRL